VSEESDQNDWMRDANELLIKLPFCSEQIGITSDFSMTGFGEFTWVTRKSTAGCQILSHTTRLEAGVEITNLRLTLNYASTGRGVMGCRWLMTHQLSRNLFIPTGPGMFYFQIERKKR